MTKKKGLGRGLGSLIPQDSIEESLMDSKNESEILEMEIDRLYPRHDQPRKEFDEDGLNELKESIEEFGIIQPIIVRPVGSEYEIVAGERRYRASLLAKLETVPVRIIEASDKEIMEISIIENIQREDLNPYEEATAYEELMRSYNYTQKELAERIGKSRSYIANTVRLLKLDPEIIAELKEGNITSTQARTLLSIGDKRERFKMLEKLLMKKSSVREVEKRTTNKRPKDIYKIEIEERLVDFFGTKVNLKPKKKGGKIEILYMSNEDLERILEILGGM
ncbi:ParB/RepB/Spo0J family partition protein [Lagierella sp.]|uniref:ParB/RepB/Spo0J family partition protein n=1 Tax=Lagierella sp. TaxID=2849657 RepID=UPI0026037A4C|nr:ParB/RepB/Spo0J family partition protein [Lagierella sp.]